jgi:hypothetical protein
VTTPPATTPTTRSTPTAAPGTYGSDPRFDSLADSCQAGDFAACDQLYEESAFGSFYEDYGSTCGERNAPTSGNCFSIYG